MASSVEAPPNAELPALSERAKKRLRLAAGFLRGRGLTFPKQGDFYQQVLAALEEQPDHERLRQLVDWVEAYDNTDPDSGTGGRR